MALSVCCSDIWCDPWLEKFVGAGVRAVNLLSLTRGTLCFPQTIQWGGNFAGYAPSAEELLCLGCSAVLRNEIQSSAAG